MKSLVAKRSICIVGHKTSITLEDAFWNGLKEIASVRDKTRSELVAEIDSERQGNLSSAIRLFVLDFYRYQRFEIKRNGSSTLCNGPRDGQQRSCDPNDGSIREQPRT